VNPAAKPARPAARVYRRLLGFLDGRRGVFSLALFAVAMDAAGQAMFIYLLRPLIDDTLVTSTPTFDLMLPALVLGAVILRVIGNYGGMFGMEWIGRAVIADLRRDLFGRYLTLPFADFDREGSGSMISRLTYNTEQVAQAATTALIGVARDSLIVLGLLIVMLLQSWRLTMTMLLLLPVVAFVVFVVSRRFRKISTSIQDSMGAVTHMTEQAVHAQEVIRIFDGQGQEAEAFAQSNHANRKLHLKLRATQLMSSSLIQVAAGLAVVALLVIAGSQFMRAEVTAGIFMSVLAAMVATIPPLKRLTNVHVLIQRPESIRGRIEFQRVCFRYPDTARPTLEDIDLTLESGTVTALVGRSGSGKTTLARLLPRFFHPTSGAIMLDGVDLEEYSLRPLRRAIALVGQQVVLFDGSIEDNIRYGMLSHCTREQVAQAAQDAWAMEFIDRLPNGLDTVIGSNGIQLSGGQRQRVAIARALLKNAPVLILDEATSALDAESEKLVQRGLARLMTDRTTLVIAHRLTTVERADQVVVLDAGRIVERGSHASLLAEQGSLYQHLYQAQFRDPGASAG
jgi:subfamily B ATP-binding cassette protein MsbA